MIPLVRPTDDDMVSKFNPTYVHCLFDTFCQINIFPARIRVPARMVVHQDHRGGRVADGHREYLARVHDGSRQTAY